MRKLRMICAVLAAAALCSAVGALRTDRAGAYESADEKQDCVCSAAPWDSGEPAISTGTVELPTATARVYLLNEME